MWKLDYDGTLCMYIREEDTSAFVAGTCYKLSLKRYIYEVLSGFVRFKPTLTYQDYKKIISICRKEADKKGFEIVITEGLQSYIDGREMHLGIRSRLGIEVKNKDDKLIGRYEEYRNVVDGEMTRKLREKQMWDSFFMYSMKKSANFSVPGSGKTASLLGVYAYLHKKNNVRRVVVVCPKNAFGSWIDEFSICFDGKETANVLNIHDAKYKSVHQRAIALQYDSGNCNLILVNYESVGGVIESLLQLVDENCLLVFDEVHKVKRIEGEYATNALRLAREATYVVAMTGTPIPNSYMDIYNLLHILYPDEYDEFFNFSVPMLRAPSKTEIESINDKLQPFFCRTTKDQLQVPCANVDKLIEIKASEDENRILNILKMKYRENKLALMIRILQMESNPDMLLQNLDLRDFEYLIDESKDIDEIDFVDYSKEIRELISGCNITSKFNKCIDLVGSLANQGKTAIIWCMFVDSIQRIKEKLEAEGIRCHCIYGEVPLDERNKILTAFKEGELQVLITNPHTLAESVSLHSVCHDAIYFEYSYNLVHLLQSKDRIHRLGLKKDQYTQYYYLQQYYDLQDGEWSLNGSIYERLKEKEKIMLDAIDRHVLETMPTSDEDLEMIFKFN